MKEMKLFETFKVYGFQILRVIKEYILNHVNLKPNQSCMNLLIKLIKLVHYKGHAFCGCEPQSDLNFFTSVFPFKMTGEIFNANR